MIQDLLATLVVLTDVLYPEQITAIKRDQFKCLTI